MKQDNVRVPFIDLVAPHLEMADELVSVFKTALRSARFIGGAMLESFEADFANYCETKYWVGVSVAVHSFLDTLPH